MHIVSFQTFHMKMICDLKTRFKFLFGVHFVCLVYYLADLGWQIDQLRPWSVSFKLYNSPVLGPSLTYVVSDFGPTSNQFKM